MNSKHHIEQEIKLTAPDPVALERLIDHALVRPLVIDTGLPFDAQRFAASYYDTPDWALRDMRWSLRTRFEGERHVGTLKRNSTIENGFSSCEEIEQAVSGRFETVASLPVGKIADALHAVLPGSTRLQPRVSVTMARRKRVLEIAGTRIELVTDSGIIAANGRQYELHEVELECLQGDLNSTQVRDFTRQLIDTFALRPSQQSKHQIGLSLYHSS